LAVASRESLLGVYGYYQDQTVILEIDEQGRILYGFLGTAKWYYKVVIAIGIIQNVTSESVFYYDGYNIVSKGYDESRSDKLNENIINSNFNGDAINTLKDENDWGKPLDPNRYFETRINAEKPYPLNDRKLSKVYETLPVDIGVSECIFLNADRSGLMVYLMIDHINDLNGYGKSFLIMFDSSGRVIPSTGIYELTDDDIINYQIPLRDFKERNGWAFTK